MGTTMSTEPRRISFDNTFAMSTNALSVPKSIENNENIIGFHDLPPETSEDLIMFPDKSTYSEVPKERELDYWAQRMENLKKEHQAINKILETEYNKQIEHIENTYETPKMITQERMMKIKPCFDWRSKILKCYEENPHQTLMCSAHVQAFANCVASCKEGE